MSGQYLGSLSKFGCQHSEPLDLKLDSNTFVGNKNTQAVLNRAARPAFPGRVQLGDFVERAAKLLCPGDEPKSSDRCVVVYAIAVGGATGLRQEPNTFVVTDCRCRNICVFCELGDSKGVRHTLTLNLEVDFKVKPQPTGG